MGKRGRGRQKNTRLKTRIDYADLAQLNNTSINSNQDDISSYSETME